MAMKRRCVRVIVDTNMSDEALVELFSDVSEVTVRAGHLAEVVRAEIREDADAKDAIERTFQAGLRPEWSRNRERGTS